jgi:hypothetical protein
VVAETLLTADSGSLSYMSLIYSAAIGLIMLAEFCVTEAEPAGHTPAVVVMQTGWEKVPCSIAVVGSVGVNVV